MVADLLLYGCYFFEQFGMIVFRCCFIGIRFAYVDYYCLLLHRAPHIIFIGYTVALFRLFGWLFYIVIVIVYCYYCGCSGCCIRILMLII